MELILSKSDITGHANVPIEELSIEHFPIFDVVGVWSFDRITYHCPTGLVKYLKHEDKSLIGKIGVENLSNESLDNDGYYYSTHNHEPFLDGIYLFDKIAYNPIVTTFSERIDVSYERFNELRRKYPRKDCEFVIELIKTGRR